MKRFKIIITFLAFAAVMISHSLAGGEITAQNADYDPEIVSEQATENMETETAEETDSTAVDHEDNTIQDSEPDTDAEKVVVSTNPQLNRILKELYTTTDLSAVTRVREYNNYTGIDALRFFDSDNTTLLQINFSGESDIKTLTNGYALLGEHNISSGETKDYNCYINSCVNTLELMPALSAYVKENEVPEEKTEELPAVSLSAQYEEVDWLTDATITDGYRIDLSGVLAATTDSRAYTSPISVKRGYAVFFPAPAGNDTSYCIAKVIEAGVKYEIIGSYENKEKIFIIDEDCDIILDCYKDNLLKTKIYKTTAEQGQTDATRRLTDSIWYDRCFSESENVRNEKAVQTTITSGKRWAYLYQYETASGYDIASFTAKKNKVYRITYQPGSNFTTLLGVVLFHGNDHICAEKPTQSEAYTVYVKDFAGRIDVSYRNNVLPTIYECDPQEYITAAEAIQIGNFTPVPTKGQILYEADTKSENGHIVNAVAYQDGIIIAARADGKIVRIGYDGAEETLLQVDGSGLDWRGLYMDSNENVYASPHASNGTLTMTERGLYRLAKGENSFTKVISLYNPSSAVPSEAEENDDMIWTLCEDKYGDLYAGVYSHTVHQNPAVYKSTDSGVTWTYLYNFYTAGDTPGTNARHIHSIIYSKWQDALYCIVGEVNTIFKSTNGGSAWTNLDIQLDHDKGAAMLAVENGIIIGSDGAYNCAIDILYNDDITHDTVYTGPANTVFAIRQSDVTGMIYVFCKIDSSATSSSYYPPASVLNLSGEELTEAINSWKTSAGEAVAAKWQAYHDSVVDLYPEDAIIPQHYAILVSRDGGKTFETLKRWKVNVIEPYGFWATGYFENGECLAGRYAGKYINPIVISEGRHRYVSGGCDLTGEIMVRTNVSETVEPIVQELLR